MTELFVCAKRAAEGNICGPSYGEMLARSAGWEEADPRNAKVGFVVLAMFYLQHINTRGRL